MKNKKLLIVFTVAITLIITLALSSLSEKMNEDLTARQHQHLENDNTTNTLDDSIDISSSEFKSHLPVVILDTNGQEIKSKLDTDGDPRININVKIIDNKDKLNTLSDTPTIDTISSVRYRGNSSLYYDKKQYALKFYNEDGTENITEVMGMAAGCDWVLNGTFLDKSHIRNYVAYNIAGEIMEYAPNIKFCEVFIFDGERYSYQGLYTMIESIERAVSRVDITKYDETRVESSYIIRRDRYSKDEVMLYNYGTTNQLTSEWLGVKYPSAAKLTDATYEYIQNDISAFEMALYSDDYETFMGYKSFIDIDSFVDYHVINEFFANYDAGLHSTYAYKDLTGKLTMGPVWDYDGAMDNATPWTLEPDATAFHSAAWFNRLIKDEDYCKKVVNRYNELRKTYLSDEYIDAYIDDIVAYLGKAIERDHLIWGYVYDLDTLKNDMNENGVVTDRNVDTFEEEIERIKLALHKHAQYLDTYFYNDIAGNTLPVPETLTSMTIIAVLFVVSFFAIVIIVRQE